MATAIIIRLITSDGCAQIVILKLTLGALEIRKTLLEVTDEISISLVSTAVVALLLHSRCREFDPLTRHHFSSPALIRSEDASKRSK